MGTEWKEVKVGEVCEVFDGPHATPKRTDNGPVFLGISSLNSGRIDLSQSDHVSEEDFVKWTKRVTPESGDIVFSYETRLGEAGLIPTGLRCCLGRRMGLLRIKDRTSLDPSFLLYNYLGPAFQAVISERTVFGSTVERIPLKDVPGFPMTIPPISEQKAIAHILGTLDEKIELNRKTNGTLEGIAKALFKSWFVDFDPVRAKAEGRPTGLPDEISELFPDSFEESELGEIPSGWSVSSIKDQSSYLSRGISPKYCEDDEGVVVLNQKCIRDGAIDFSKSRRHDPAKKKIEGRVISRFDCLVNSTGVGTLGRVAIVPELAFGDVIVDSHVTVVRGSSEHSTFYLTNTLLNRQPEIEALGEGSTGQTELSRAVLGEMGLVVPPEGLLNAFFSLAVCLFEKRWSNESASTTLSSLRDALLPRLISGELRVPDVEKMLEEAGV